MAIKYLSGKRLQGTAAERTALNTSAPPATSWKELTRSVAITSETHTITTPTFAAKDNLKVLIYGTGADNSGVRPRIQFNSDTGSNYSYRESNNGNTDATGEDTTSIYISESDCEGAFSAVLDITNIANKEKLVITDSGRTSNNSAGTAPSRYEGVGKWANTSNQITSISMIAYTTTAQGFSAGWEIVVLGCDNDEADSGTNFFQKISDVTLSSTGNLDSGTFTAKKYLLVETYHSGMVSGNDLLRFNEDSGSNYSDRKEADGGTDAARTVQSSLLNHIGEGGRTTPAFTSWYIFTKSDNVKLMICKTNQQLTAGNSSGRIPTRLRLVGKWSNTSDAITRINAQGNFPSGSRMTIWGSD